MEKIVAALFIIAARDDTAAIRAANTNPYSGWNKPFSSHGYASRFYNVSFQVECCHEYFQRGIGFR
jgi:hypothetical protein